MDRNPFESVRDKPLTEEQVREVRERLAAIWEDTMIVTQPNGIRIEQAGNIRAMCDMLLWEKKLSKKKSQ